MLIVRTLVAQGCIYNDMYDFENYIDVCLKASDISYAIGRHDYRFKCLLYGLNGATLLRNKLLSDSIDNILKIIVSNDENKVEEFNTYQMPYVQTFGTDNEIRQFLDSIPDEFIFDQDGLLCLAGIKVKVGENKEAEMILSQIRKSGMQYDTLKYLAISVDLLQNQNRFEDALETYRDFSRKTDSIDIAVFGHKKISLMKSIILK